MDSTLFKTNLTAADTRVYLPNSYLDQSNLSRQNQSSSRVLLPPRIQQSMLMMNQQNLAPTANVYQGVCVYCPVCKREYSNTQVDLHASIHDSSFNYNFMVPNSPRVGATNFVDAELNKSKATLDASQVSASSGAVQYPLVEPLQFWTNELNTSAKSDIFIFRDNKNYDNVDKTLFQPKSSKVVSYIDSSAQTNRRPPLQYESNQTNLYNCFDNAVNSGHGPSFSFADLGKNNAIVTPKRELDDWELMQKMQTRDRVVQPRTIGTLSKV